MQEVTNYSSDPPQKLYSMVLRFGLAVTALLCLTTATSLWTSGDMVRQKISVILAMVLYILVFSLIITSARKSIPEKLVWVIIPVILIILSARVHIYNVQQEQAGSRASTTDVLIFGDYSAYLLTQGKNPYQADLIDAFRVFRNPMVHNTPLLDGDFTAQVAYPALSFLIFVPFHFLGISTSYVYPLFLVLTLLLIFIASPKLFRPIILLPFFIVPEYINYTLGGVSDGVWAFLICAMIIVWKHKWGRAVFYGLACAFKQMPMVLAPFLLIRLWKSSAKPGKERIKDLGYFAGTSVLIFLVFNGPFMVWDFNSWFQGLIEPFRAAMIVFGQGLSSLTMLGYILVPGKAYTFLVAAVLLIALLLYGLNYHRYPELMWFIPGIVLWFGHRSLTSYWYFFVFPFWIALVRGLGKSNASNASEHKKSASSRKLSIALLAAIPILIAGTLGFYSFVRPPEIILSAMPPYLTKNGLINQLDVMVSNRSNSSLTPRFSVQSWTNQPYFWHIDSGPLELPSGSQAAYQISTDLPNQTFPMDRGIQLVVSDAHDYVLRGSITLEGETTARYYDGIPNGTFEYWNQASNSVHQWGEIMNPTQSDPVGLVYDPELDGSVLQINLSNLNLEGWSTAMLDVWLNFPENDIQIWVNPPAIANHLDDLSVAYGLELISTGTFDRIWVLFGDREAQGQFEPGHYFWMLPAPKDVWSRQTLDLQRIFNDLDLEIAAPGRLIRHGQDFPVSMLNFRLLLASQPSTDLPLVAQFGPVSSVQVKPDPLPLILDGLSQPEETLIWRAEYNFSARNFKKAQDYYLRAYQLQPGDERILFGLAETNFWLGEYDMAINYYKESITGMYRVADSYRGLGWSNFNLAKIEAAELAFRRAIEINPSMADAFNGLGLISLGRGQCGLAESNFLKATSLSPRFNLPQVELERCRGD
jgi:uncharacterized membrane protein/tetratricopeptide (TPR) repeat protein